MDREQQLADAFVSVSDTLADDVDPLVLLERLARQAVALTGAEAAGVLLAPARGGLRPLAVCDDGPEVARVLRAQAAEGPVAECVRTGLRADAPGLAADDPRWPGFARAAHEAGFRGAYGLPLEAAGRPVGGVGLLTAAPEALPERELGLVRALSRAAVAALVRWRPDGPRPHDVLTQVHSAVAARAAIDTAAGMLAEYGGTSPAEGVAALYTYGARRGVRPAVVAGALLRRALSPGTVAGGPGAATGGDLGGADPAGAREGAVG
ncbi:GAF domain-containing protein [Streptomyces sp. NPDC047002]|uniref:GAF domain-containing protein n=1 Tax=Streptomyces sp. NPDC047002 TaxID=3155475 RepID=UPI003453DC37